MDLIPIQPPPGIFTVPTSLTAGARWVSSSLIRFFNGTLETLGGWARLTSQTFVGVCRGLKGFTDLAGNQYIAIGTNQRLQLLLNGAITDITPVRATTNIATPFSVSSGSVTITVNDATTVAVGDWVDITTQCYAAGVKIQGFVEVAGIGSGTWTFVSNFGTPNATGAAVGSTTTLSTTSASALVTLTDGGGYTFVNAETYDLFKQVVVGGITLAPGAYVVSVSGGTATITASAPATSAASAQENSGSVEFQYVLETAIESPATGSAAYGGGAYGTGPYGTGGTSSTPIGGWQRQWSLDVWGTGNENLIASPTGGGIYQWTPPIAVANTATLVPNAPAQNSGFFTTSSQQLMAFGAYDALAGVQNPLLLRWCDVANNTDWTATATNQAGSFQIPLGTQIMSAVQDDGQVLVWTDEDLWAGQYLGFPLVWGFQRIGRQCGLLAKRCVGKIGGVWTWAGTNSFWTFDGQSVRPLPCAVWDQFYGTAVLANAAYKGDIHLATDSQFFEFFVFFPTPGGGDLCNQYVKFNRMEGGGVWDIGTLAAGRTAWVEDSWVGTPIGADNSGLIQQHEVSPNADGAAMDCFAQTGWIALGEGEEFVHIRHILADFKLLTGALLVNVTLYFVNYADANEPPRQYGPYAVNSGTAYLPVRGRGRYVSVRVENGNSGGAWRLGNLKARAAPMGRR